MTLDARQTSSIPQRRARTRSLIQLGGLMERAGTLEVFNIPLGTDLQTDLSIKNNIAALFKSFLIINEMVTSKELDLNVLALQGLEAFKQKGLSEFRPLDRKKDYELPTYSANQNDKQNKLKEQPIITTEEKM